VIGRMPRAPVAVRTWREPAYVPAGLGLAVPARLVLEVRDDGWGGAALDGAGTGLAGPARRAAALDGTPRVDSPPGGPTAVTVTLEQLRTPVHSVVLSSWL
jgi:hypothetical protein